MRFAAIFLVFFAAMGCSAAERDLQSASEGGAGGNGGSTGTGGVTSSGASCRTPGSGLTDCGPTQESCCTSPLVTGGAFYRSYDGVTYTDQSYPATVSDFRLDKYEITVGRFRKFVEAWDGGWRPAAGAGKHVHLNGGQGLLDVGTGSTYEPGWDTLWDTTTYVSVPEALACDSLQTWTPSIGSNERRPINCITWFEAYAFCIWDGGFLPSEAEWNYAAAGGDEQRVYPWSRPATATKVDCTFANFNPGGYCSSTHTNDAGSESPTGDGRYSQADLAGNVFEWTLDWYAGYLLPSNDSAQLKPASDRVIRGGGFTDTAPALLSSWRISLPPPNRTSRGGARCARVP